MQTSHILFVPVRPPQDQGRLHFASPSVPPCGVRLLSSKAVKRLTSQDVLQQVASLVWTTATGSASRNNSQITGVAKGLVQILTFQISCSEKSLWILSEVSNCVVCMWLDISFVHPYHIRLALTQIALNISKHLPTSCFPTTTVPTAIRCYKDFSMRTISQTDSKHHRPTSDKVSHPPEYAWSQTPLIFLFRGHLDQIPVTSCLPVKVRSMSKTQRHSGSGRNGSGSGRSAAGGGDGDVGGVEQRFTPREATISEVVAPQYPTMPPFPVSPCQSSNMIETLRQEYSASVPYIILY